MVSDTDEHVAIGLLLWLPLMLFAVFVSSIVTSCECRQHFEREAVGHAAGSYTTGDRGVVFKWNDELKTAEKPSSPEQSQ